METVELESLPSNINVNGNGCTVVIKEANDYLELLNLPQLITAEEVSILFNS